MLQKPIDTVVKSIAGIAALNWALIEFTSFDVLNFIPDGIFMKVVVGLIGLSGLYILSLVYNKRI